MIIKSEEDVLKFIFKVYPLYQTTVNQMPLIFQTLRGSYKGLTPYFKTELLSFLNKRMFRSSYLDPSVLE